MLTYVQFHLNLKNRFYNQIGLMKGYLLFINPIFDVEYKTRTYEMIMTLSHMYGGVVMSCLMFGL